VAHGFNYRDVQMRIKKLRSGASSGGGGTGGPMIGSEPASDISPDFLTYAP